MGAGRRGRSGQVVVLFVALLGLLLGAVGLMVDGGRMYFERRRAQNAADATAVSGAYEIKRGNDLSTPTVQGWVKQDAGLHGFQPAEVTILYPPTSGDHAGDLSFLTVDVVRNVPLTFMRIVGKSSGQVRARATGGLRAGGQACVMALSPNDSPALKASGNPTFVANCGIMVNSSAQGAFEVNGTNSCVTADWIGVAGGANSGPCVTPQPTTSVPPMLDPFANTPIPAPGPAGVVTDLGGGKKLYSPGYYDKEIKITGGNVTFAPGVYVLEAGIKISGGMVAGDGVFFYNRNSKGNAYIDIGGNAIVQLSAPTSGTYKGMLFMGPTNGSTNGPGNKIARGNSDSFFNGAAYFPSEHLDWGGNPQSNGWGLAVAYTMEVHGTSDTAVTRPPDANEAPAGFTSVMLE